MISRTPKARREARTETAESWLAHLPPGWLRRWEIGVLAAGLVVTLAIYAALAHWESDRRSAEIREHARLYGRAVRSELRGFTDAAQAVADFIGATGGASAAALDRFGGALLTRNPDIESIAWMARVTDAEGDAVETATRDQGLPPFAIRDPEDADGSGPAARRPELYPVARVIPANGTAQAIAADIQSDPALETALAQALESGLPAAAIVPTLTGESARRRSLVVLAPVPVASASGGRGARSPPEAQGVAAVYVPLGGLIGSAIASLPPHPIALILRAPFIPGDGGILETSPAPGAEPSQTPIWSALVREPEADLSRLAIADRTLLLLAAPTPGAYPVASWPKALLALGLAVALALTRLAAERRRAWTRLREQERLFHLFMDHSPTVAWIKDPEGRWLYMNRTHAELFGVRPEDWQGKRDCDLWPPAVAEGFRAGDRAALVAGGPFESLESVQTADGAIRRWQVLKIPFRDAAGRRYLGGIALDVSDRVRAQEALRTSEERLRLALDAAGMGVYDWELTTGRLLWSPRHAALWEYPEDTVEVDYARFAGRIHPDDLTRVEAEIARSRTTGQRFCAEFRLLLPRGGLRWIQGLGDFACDASGQPLRMTGVALDITARKEAELGLGRYRQIVETASEMLVFLDRDLRIRLANPAYAALHGTTPAALQGQRLCDVEGPEIGPQLVQCLEDSRTGETRQVAMSRIDRSGKTRWIEADLRAYREDGAIAGVVVSLHDLTGAREAERALEAERATLEERVAERTATLRTLAERLQLATEAGDIGIWEWNMDTDRLDWDDRMYRLHGRCRSDGPVTQADWIASLHPDDLPLLERSMDQVLSGEMDRFRIVWRTYVPSGERRYIVTSGKVIRDPEGRAERLIGVNWDITELKLAQEQAQEAARTKSQFLANMSHEIRTPINAVIGIAQLLEREHLADDQRRLVRQILLASRSLLALVGDVLDFSRIEAGQLPLERRPFAPAAILVRVEALMGPMAQAKDLTLHMETPPDLAECLLGDPLRIEQILVNLVGNAVKFTERGEVGVRVEQSPVGDDSVSLRIQVTDTGLGIAPERLADLFEPFAQEDASISRRFGGTGLGLSIAKHLTELMGGTLAAESRVGEGSRFWVDLAFERVAPGELTLPEEAPAEPPAGPRLGGLRILIVDDNEMTREVLERMLASEGAGSLQAADGRQALDLLRADPQGFDAVLMDIQMPGMDGLAATRAIRGDLGLSALPLIAFTAGGLETQRQAAARAGLDDFLLKPVELGDLVATLLRLTARSRPLERAPASATAALGSGATGFPSIAGLDVARAAHLLDHDLELFYRRLRRFAAEFGSAATDVREDLDRGDRIGAAARLHRLRGNAGYLGATDLVGLADALERAIAEGDWELHAPLGAFEEGLGATIDAIRPWLGPRPTNPTPPDRCPPMEPERLAALRAALADRNVAAVALLESLEPTLKATLGPHRAETLGQLIRALRFDRALELLEGDEATTASRRNRVH